ncbi:hypothetical protein BKA93DRAFT_753904 [Sparassis latifolia]
MQRSLVPVPSLSASAVFPTRVGFHFFLNVEQTLLNRFCNTGHHHVQPPPTIPSNRYLPTVVVPLRTRSRAHLEQDTALLTAIDDVTISPSLSSVSSLSDISSSPPSPIIHELAPMETAATEPTRIYPPTMTKKVATVEFPKESQAPKLLPGDLTPSVINTWQTACERHFRKAQLADELQVSMVASRMDYPHLAVWYDAHQGRLDALSFEDFMMEVRATYLPHDWDSTIRDESKAAVISRTTQALDNTELRQQLRAGVNARLKKKMNSPHHARELNDIVLFSQWLLAVKELDEELCEEDDRVNTAVANAVAKECAKHFTARPLANKTNTDKSSSSAGAKRSAADNVGSTFTKLQKITQDERNVLQKYRGCYKCCLPEQDHTSATCPNGFPDAASYTPISEANVADRIKAVKDGKRKVAAAVVQDASEEPAYVAAVFPVNQTSVLGDGSDSDDNDTD